MAKHCNPDAPAYARPSSEETLPGCMPESMSTVEASGGPTKREWFAGLALSGLLAGITTNPSKEYLAGQALACADALIEALNQRGGDA